MRTASRSPLLTTRAPRNITRRGPYRSIRPPRNGAAIVETSVPTENAPAVKAKRPAKLLVNRRKEEGNCPRYGHTDTHCDEGDSHDDPTIKERPAAPHA